MSSTEKIPGEFKNLPKENPFTVPEGYFEGFKDRIMERVKPPDSIKTNIFHGRRSYKSILSIAAGFILFAAISYAFLHFILGNGTEKLPTGNQYAKYIEKDLISFDDNLLISAYNETSVKQVISEQEVSGESLIEYLLIEDVELDLIISEF